MGDDVSDYVVKSYSEGLTKVSEETFGLLSDNIMDKS